MKKVQKIISNLTLVMTLLSAILLANCKKNEEEEPLTDQQLRKISFTWTAAAVTLDDVAQPAYGNFKITCTRVMGSKTFAYTTDGRPNLSPWPASGSFTFDEATPLTALKRDDGLVANYQVSESALTVTFNYSMPGYPGSRANAVRGKWEFIFTR
jgi:hypothetical protein